jgi:hypothetical protein
LTFDHVAEKAIDGNSGRSRKVARGRQEIRDDRLHPKPTNSPFRPIPAHRRALKLPDDRPGSFTFRIYEAAVRGLRRPAMSGPCTLEVDAGRLCRHMLQAS